MLSTKLRPLNRRRIHQTGSSLIEVLVSVLLMSFGLLAVAGMQAYSIAAQKNASNRAIANSLASEMAEVIRLNGAQFNNAVYNLALLPGDPKPDDFTGETCGFKSGAVCDGAGLAKDDASRFLSRVRSILPNGGVMISNPTPDQRDLWIMWTEPAVMSKSGETTFDNCPDEAKALDPQPRCFYMKFQL